MPHAALLVVQPNCRSLEHELGMGFNAARGFVGGATWIADNDLPHGVVFQCRTRLCWWCNLITPSKQKTTLVGFNAARGFVGGAARRAQKGEKILRLFQCRTRLCGWCSIHEFFKRADFRLFQCRTRLCGWCSLVALSSFPPRGKKPFWKVSGNLSVLTENM